MEFAPITTMSIQESARAPMVNDAERLERAEDEICLLRAQLAEADDARRRAEEALRATQRLAGIGSWSWDLATDELVWSDEMYRIHGVEGRHIERLDDYLSLLPASYRQALLARTRRALADHAPYEAEVTLVCADGSIRRGHTRAHVELGDDGRPVRIHGTLADITERKAIESRLSDREAQLRAIVESTPDRITIRDLDGRYLLMNPAAAAEFGLPHEAVVGKLDVELFQEDTVEAMRATDRQVLQEGRTLTYEIVLNTHSCLLGTYLVAKHPYTGPDGRHLGVISIARDISDRVERERLQAAQIDKLRELDRLKSSFVGSVSHELRTPLTMIKGYAEFLADGVAGPLAPLQQDFVTQIELATSRLEAVVDDLLDFARIDAGTFKLAFVDTEVNSQVREVLGGFGPQLAEAGIALTAELPQVPTPARLDAKRFAQVLTNLVSNAIKFTPAGGRVHVRLAVGTDRLRLEVSDTGAGIAEEDLCKLFKRFSRLDNSTTRETTGTGLGLSISKVIVEGHGGTIGVDSEPGSGSTFWFELPMRPLGA